MQAPNRPANEVQRQAALDASGLLDTPTEERFDRLVRLAAQVCEAPIALISLVDRERQWFKARVGLETVQTDRCVSFCGHVVAEEAPLVVEDARKDQRFSDNPLVTGAPALRSYVGLPIRSADGFVLGSLCVIDREPRKLEPGQLESLVDLVALVEHELHREDLVAVASALNESRRELSVLVEAGLDAVVGIDQAGVITEFNPAAERIFGFQRDQAIGQPMAELIIPEYLRSAHQEGMRRYLDSGEAKVIGRRVEITARRANGELFPCELSVVAVSDERKHFYGQIRDITERVHGRAVIERLNSQLNTMFSLSPDGFAVFDQDGVLSLANDALADMTGLKPHQIQGMSLIEFDAVFRRASSNPESVAPIVDPRSEHSDELEMVGEPVRVLRREIRPLVRKGGAAVGMLLFLRDVTQDRRLTQMKSEFLAAAAHELRTPMASIHGYTELLLARSMDDGQRQEILQTILDQSTHLVALLSDLLDLSRLESRAVREIKLEPIDLGDLIRQQVERFSVSQPDREIRVELSGACPAVLGDRDMLIQVVDNLLSNACKYSPERKPVDICWAAVQEPGWLAFCVIDQGVGMSEEECSRATDRFYRAGRLPEVTGTGLGLSFVAEIIERHGGRLQIDSSPDRGARITVGLPQSA